MFNKDITIETVLKHLNISIFDMKISGKLKPLPIIVPISRPVALKAPVKFAAVLVVINVSQSQVIYP